MNTSLAWLNRYLDRPVDADEADRLLTAVGFPIDGREDAANGDVMLDVEVTSNRPDCLSHVGQAREIASASGRALKPPQFDLPAAGAESVDSAATVRNEEAELCPLYTARVIKGVRVGPSPAWLVALLETVGLRSVNNVVDVTNFVLLEMGQPLHAFDMGKLNDKTIVVRRAAEGEAFTAIDGTQHKLKGHMLVIADSQAPVAVAGVMGGLDSEVGEQTTDVLLESAIFDPLSVRKTGRMLKLQSDSSFRFERGVDPVGVDRASQRAAQLICELAGGTLCEGVIRAGQDEPKPHQVSMRIDRCLGLLGIDVPIDEMMTMLAQLGLEPALNEAQRVITCTIPTHRLDLHREVDLIEEVARHHGYDNVHVQEKIHIEARPPQPRLQARRKLRGILSAYGYFETVNFSFIAPKYGQPFLADHLQPVMVDDERRKAEPMLRPSLIPSLMLCRKINQDVGNQGVKIYETAVAWQETHEKSEAGVPRVREQESLTLMSDVGASLDDALREMRGLVEEIESGLGGRFVAFEPMDPTTDSLHHHVFDPAASARVIIDDCETGLIGLMSKKMQDLFDLQQPVIVANLDLPELLGAYPPQRTVAPLSRFPAIERDLSIVVEEQVRSAQIEDCVKTVNPDLLEDTQFVGVYRGKPIAKGSKSVTFRMTYRDPAATLRHEQVDPQVEAVVERLKAQVGAELRT